MFVRVLICAAVLTVAAACDKPTEPAPTEAPKTAAQAAEVKDAPKPPEPQTQQAAEEAAGKWVGNETYGVKFRVPSDWKVKETEKSLSATSPDDTITVLLVGTGSDGVLTTAVETIKSEVQFKDFKMEKDSQTVLNGMPGHAAQGSAVLVQEGGDQEIQFIMNAVQAGDQGVALMVFAEAEMYEARREEVHGITRTLQRM